MESKNLNTGTQITLTTEGLPEEQIQRAIQALNLGQRVSTHCGNVYPSGFIPGSEECSSWFNPSLLYEWQSENPIVREVWKAEHLIVAHNRLRGGSK